jgi:hypothetical protein
MHSDLEALQRLRHGELPHERAVEVRRHLEQCAECRDRSSGADDDEREAMALLGRLGAPVRHATFETIVAETPRFGRRQALRAAAAGLLVVALGGVAWAIPGSPLRALLGSNTTAAKATGAVGPSAAADTSALPSNVAGIAVVSDSPLVIHFTTPAPDATLRVSMVQSELVQVRAPVGSVRFQSDARRLTVANDHSLGAVDIDVPRLAPRVEIRLGDRRIFLKDGDRVDAVVDASPDGSYRIPLR